MAILAPIIITIIILVSIYYVLFAKGAFKSIEYSKQLQQKIHDFKNRTFSSYEEESKAKQQIRQELLQELEGLSFPKNYKKVFEARIDVI